MAPDAAPLEEVLSYYWWNAYGERIAKLKAAVTAGNFSGANVASPVVAKAITKAEISALEALREEDDSKYNAIIAAPIAANNGPLASTARDEWAASHPWTTSRKAACIAAVNLLIDIVGDKRVDAYQKPDVKHFKDVLSKLPANRKKLRSTRGKTLGEIAKIGLTPMSLTTANAQIRIVSLFFKWANETYDGVDGSLFAGKGWKKQGHQRDEGESFSIDDLKAIFQAPVFTGCLSEDRWAAPGSEILRSSSKFWMPLLALYTGARSHELCKLRACDVKTSQGGAIFLDVNQDEQIGVKSRVKTRSSVRVIPVHDDLLAFGLAEFVDSRRNETRLFPDIKPNKEGKLSDAWGKHFNRFLKSIGIKRKRINFHSFRHTWVDGCTDSGISSDTIRAVKGDARPGTLDRYGTGKTAVDVLAPEMAKLKFIGLDLDRLRRELLGIKPGGDELGG